MRVNSYITLTVAGGRIVGIVKTEEELQRLVEALKRYGVVLEGFGVSRCG